MYYGCRYIKLFLRASVDNWMVYHRELCGVCWYDISTSWITIRCSACFICGLKLDSTALKDCNRWSDGAGSTHSSTKHRSLCSCCRLKLGDAVIPIWAMSCWLTDLLNDDRNLISNILQKARLSRQRLHHPFRTMCGLHYSGVGLCMLCSRMLMITIYNVELPVDAQRPHCCSRVACHATTPYHPIEQLHQWHHSYDSI